MKHFSDLQERTKDNQHFIIKGLSQTKFSKLSDVLIQRNSYVRNLYSSLSKLLQKGDEDNFVVIQILILLYLEINGNNGHSPYWHKAYHGVCYPDACTLDEINTSNFIFSNLVFHENPKVFSLPFMAYPGCSDDERYKVMQDWKPINWIAVMTTGLIGVFIMAGTILDVYCRSIESDQKMGRKTGIPKTKGIGLRILTAFSVVGNLEIIFSVSPQKVFLGNVNFVKNKY